MKTAWVAGWSRPGCLPESLPRVTRDWSEARDALAEEMAYHADAVESWNDEHDCDDIPCPTYDDACPWDRAQDVRRAREDLLSHDRPGPWLDHADGLTWWIEPTDETPDDER